MPQPPSNLTVKTDTTHWLSVVFNILGAISIIVGIGIGLATYSTYDSYGYGILMHRNYALLWFCIFAGVLNAFGCFALAVIVDACDKYRKTHKG